MDWTRICKSLPMIFLLTSLICACGNDEEKQEAETEKTEVQTIPTKEQVLGEIKTSGDLVTTELKIRKIALYDTSKSERLSDKILSKFFSQNVTKNYDLGAKGRRWANATFSGSHEKSEFTSCNFAIDMTKFLDEDISKTEEFIRDSLDKFCKNTVKASLKYKD